MYKNYRWKSFPLGVFKKLLTFFNNCITAVGKSFINRMVKYLAINSHRQADRTFPSIHIFKDGLDKCQLSGSEIIFKIFVLYLSIIQTNSINMLPKLEGSEDNRYKQKKSNNDNESSDEDNQDNKVRYPKIASTPINLKKWISLLECSLAFDSWLNQDSILYSDLEKPVNNDGTLGESLALKACRRYMSLFISIVNEPIGSGNLTSKLHWILHICHYIEQYGPPKVYSGQTPERVLSPLVKWAARRTQLRPSTIIEQSCDRYFENMVVQRCYSLLQFHGIVNNKLDSQLSIKNNLMKSSSTLNKRLFKALGNYNINIDSNGKFVNIKWKNNKSQTQKTIHFNKGLLQDIIDRLLKDDFKLESKLIPCYTQLHICDASINLNHKFRADPYFYKRPWMDWCNSVWKSDKHDNNNDIDIEYPCRLLMFIDIKNTKFGTDVSYLGDYAAIIKSTKDDTRKNRLNSCCKLIDTYECENFIRIIPADSISKPLFVIPDVQRSHTTKNSTSYESSHVMRIVSKEEWARLFINRSW